MTPAYRYRATLSRVIDGDTYVLRVDLGFRVSADLTFRLRGYDAAERADACGPSETAQARRLLEGASEIVVESYKDTQTFARWVADIYVDGQPLVALLAAGAGGLR